MLFALKWHPTSSRNIDDILFLTNSMVLELSASIGLSMPLKYTSRKYFYTVSQVLTEIPEETLESTWISGKRNDVHILKGRYIVFIVLIWVITSKFTSKALYDPLADGWPWEVISLAFWNLKFESEIWFFENWSGKFLLSILLFIRLAFLVLWHFSRIFPTPALYPITRKHLFFENYTKENDMVCFGLPGPEADVFKL